MEHLFQWVTGKNIHKNMNMIRHDAPCMKVITFLIKIEQDLLHQTRYFMVFEKAFPIALIQDFLGLFAPFYFVFGWS